MPAHSVFTAVHISTHAHEHCLTAPNWTKIRSVTALETVADVGPVSTALKRQTLYMVCGRHSGTVTGFIDIDIDIFINFNWVVTRWQYKFTHKQYMEQHK